MISIPLGIISFIIVMVASAWGVRASDYVNGHSFLVVVVGTVTVFITANSGVVIKTTLLGIVQLFKPRPSLHNVRQDLLQLANDRNSLKQSEDRLISYALTLWERGHDPHSFQALMSQYRDKLETDDVEAISCLQNIAKYPPAMGMLGTVMGMINLFANLGGTDKTGIGPALAVAMTATFYGLLMANGIIQPLADRIHVEATYRKKYYGLVYEILTLVNRKEPISMIEEEIEYREAA